MQLTLYRPASSENRREVACDVCRGNHYSALETRQNAPYLSEPRILSTYGKPWIRQASSDPHLQAPSYVAGLPQFVSRTARSSCTRTRPRSPRCPRPVAQQINRPADPLQNKTSKRKAQMRVQDARNPDWVPLGVWRFRELARKAFENPSWEGQTLEEALEEVGNRMEIHSSHWINHSKTLVHYRKRSLLDLYTG